MNPEILLAVVGLVAALPPIVDAWIAKRVASAKTLALLTLAVGVVFGFVGGLLSMVAMGAAVGDAAKVQLAGALSGLAAGLVNWYHAYGDPPAAGGNPALNSVTSAAPPPANDSALMRHARNWGIGAVVAFAVLVLTACSGIASPVTAPTQESPPARAEMRSDILAAATAMRVADQACSAAASVLDGAGKQGDAIVLAHTCAAAYDVTRAGLVAAQSALDAWDDAAANRVACAALDVRIGLDGMVSSVTSHFTLPSQLAAALSDIQSRIDRLSKFAGTCIQAPDAGVDAAATVAPAGVAMCAGGVCTLAPR